MESDGKKFKATEEKENRWRKCVCTVDGVYDAFTVEIKFNKWECKAEKFLRCNVNSELTTKLNGVSVFTKLFVLQHKKPGGGNEDESHNFGKTILKTTKPQCIRNCV